jgi:hypothetical protein
MRKARSLLLICFLFSLMIPGCSKDKLDRETAKAAIDKKLRGMNVGLTVTTGRVGSHCYTMQAGSETIDMDGNPEKGPDSRAAIKAGYLSSTPDGKDFWKVELTPKGQAFAQAENKKPFGHEEKNGCATDNYSLPAAWPTLVEIDAISEGEQEPEVKYYWTWHVTDLGAMLRENGELYKQLSPADRTELEHFLNLVEYGPHLPLPVPEERKPILAYPATFKFKKYDNGWRIMENQK